MELPPPGEAEKQTLTLGAPMATETDIEFRNCRFCNCRTNAKLRACCNAGRYEDLYLGTMEAYEAACRRVAEMESGLNLIVASTGGVAQPAWINEIWRIATAALAAAQPTAGESDAEQRRACPKCQKLWDNAKSEYEAGGSPQSPPMRCPHASGPSASTEAPEVAAFIVAAVNATGTGDKQLIGELKNEVFNLRSALAAAREQYGAAMKTLNEIASITKVAASFDLTACKIHHAALAAIQLAALSPSVQPTPDADNERLKTVVRGLATFVAENHPEPGIRAMANRELSALSTPTPCKHEARQHRSSNDRP